MNSRRYKKGNLNNLTLSAKRKRNRGENLANWRKKVLKTDVTTPFELDNTNDDNLPENVQCHNTPKRIVTEAIEPVVMGKRIIDIIHFFNELKNLNAHSPLGCGLSEMEILSERRRGLISEIKMKCTMCNICKIVTTEKIEKQAINSNTAAVTGIMQIGCGYSNLEEFLSTLNIPSLSINTFMKEQAVIFQAWENTALKEMESAAKEEKIIAIEKGKVDNEGIPLITVIVDGSWAKRSYKTNYASLSGVAAIVGCETGKVLFIGVRNKYCCICARAAAKNITPSSHKCYKNWSGSSSGMEADILVEGFVRSEEMYGMKYAKFIGDGDSNVHKKILDARPYNNLTVEKIECRNHLLRNTCNKLKDLARNSKYGNVSLRQIVGSRILRVRTAITMAVRHRKNETSNSIHEKISSLNSDILNVPFHVFGQHSKCASYFCDRLTIEKNYVPSLENAGLMTKVMSILGTLTDHSKSLLYDCNNNVVEQFNSIIAKFVGGKRVNYCLRGSYQARCNAAVVAHNSKKPFYSLNKFVYKNSPGHYCKLSEKRRNQRRIRLSSKKKNYRRIRLFTNNKNDISYGNAAQKPDMDKEIYTKKKENFLLSLKLNNKERESIMRDTTLQSLCPIWMEERRKRLTASNFGFVCNKLPHTKCDNLLKKMLYSYLDTPAMRYGRRHEKDAIEHLKNINFNVQPCGLIIDQELPCLAATPDGLIDKNGLVEIKCPASCSDITPEEAIISKKFTFWHADKKKNNLILNKKHIHYYQVQGQLHIANRDFCIFVLWTPKGAKIEKIDRDDLFWESKMKDKLLKFYYDCLLPELIDPRFPRSLSIRNPDYIIQAQKSKTLKLIKNS